MYLFQGKIFWREVAGYYDDGEKRRPCIIVSATNEVRDSDTVVCVACSHKTALTDPLPPRCVLLPRKVGKRDTKLPKPTAAVCYWRVDVPKSEIRDDCLAGSIGEHVLRDVLYQFALSEAQRKPDA